MPFDARTQKLSGPDSPSVIEKKVPEYSRASSGVLPSPTQIIEDPMIINPGQVLRTYPSKRDEPPIEPQSSEPRIGPMLESSLRLSTSPPIDDDEWRRMIEIANTRMIEIGGWNHLDEFRAILDEVRSSTPRCR